MKGAGLVVVVGSAAELEAPCGTTGIGNVAPSGRGGAARIRTGKAGSSSRSSGHAAIGIRSDPPCGEQKNLSSGSGRGDSSGMGGGHSRGAQAGATCAVMRAGTDPPRDTSKESSPVGGSELLGKGGGRTDGA